MVGDLEAVELDKEQNKGRHAEKGGKYQRPPLDRLAGLPGVGRLSLELLQFRHGQSSLGIWVCGFVLFLFGSAPIQYRKPKSPVLTS